MPDANDMELVREFARQNSETAFAELVRRHINLVYSVAVRFTGNPGDAEDVTQAVFILLARKAASLSDRTVLTGWLYETTRLTAAGFLRSQNRRRFWEQEAFMQSNLNAPEGDNLWRQLAPHLEAAMSRLAQRDRTLLALRFYENKTGAEAAALLGIREEAAHKRTARALEKLRSFFAKRGVDSTAAAIAENISANSIQAAPVALAKTVTAVAIAKGAAASASTLTLIQGALKIMAWTKAKTIVVAGVLVILAAGTTTVTIEKSLTKPRNNTAWKQSAGQDIAPGESVGKIKAGMTEDDVIAALGQPDRKQGEVLIYDKEFGLSVVCSQQKIVGSVFCGGGVDFKGHTKEGVGIGSSRNDLIKAMGKPTTEQRNTKLTAFDQEQLVYKPLGLTFTLQNGKVFQIVVDLRKPQ
jgi:RNA polymerase sigma factor (sigma-70 family)